MMLIKMMNIMTTMMMTMTMTMTMMTYGELLFMNLVELSPPGTRGLSRESSPHPFHQMPANQIVRWVVYTTYTVIHIHIYTYKRRVGMISPLCKRGTQTVSKVTFLGAG